MAVRAGIDGCYRASELASSCRGDLPKATAESEARVNNAASPGAKILDTGHSARPGLPSSTQRWRSMSSSTRPWSRKTALAYQSRHHSADRGDQPGRLDHHTIARTTIDQALADEPPKVPGGRVGDIAPAQNTCLGEGSTERLNAPGESGDAQSKSRVHVGYYSYSNNVLAGSLCGSQSRTCHSSRRSMPLKYGEGQCQKGA